MMDLDDALKKDYERLRELLREEEGVNSRRKEGVLEIYL